jgi:hypothetical protein
MDGLGFTRMVKRERLGMRESRSAAREGQIDCRGPDLSEPSP